MKDHPDNCCASTGAASGGGLKVVLVSPYEIGRQPFGLAEPAAWLAESGCQVACLDLSLQRLDAEVLRDADLVALYVAMHTAARIAVEALPKVRELAPHAHLCVYGLYAPVNEDLFRQLGVQTVFGGESEPDLQALCADLAAGRSVQQAQAVVNLSKIDFRVPDRSGLPGLAAYAKLVMPDGTEKTCGFAEASRGCKHLCRHCPVVPVYHGRFRTVPVDVVMQDIRRQVEAGAQHVSFGDPDFLNGPGHARHVIDALYAQFPDVTYDAVIKIEHILQYPEMLKHLKDTGCVLITMAVESVDDRILEFLDKGHTEADFVETVRLLREAGIAFNPTFVPFTPWTTLDGYLGLLRRLVDLGLVESVAPVQLAIRLLIPRGSYLLQLPGFVDLIEDFDPRMLGYPWRNADARVDALQSEIEARVATAEGQGLERRAIFARLWEMAHAAAGLETPPLPESPGQGGPHLSEQWYCCAEPTSRQLADY